MRSVPAALTYPGVYIEEIPSGVRTITGVATSVTAFIGRAMRGPVNEPKTINNFGDFERIFGGLWLKSAMSYAVHDFYLNGGAQAVIVRLTRGPAVAAELTLPADGGSLILVAADVGLWGGSITAQVNHDTKDTEDTTLFNLILSDGVTTEQHLNVSVDQDEARYISNVLEQRSQIARVKEGSAIPATRPNVTTDPVEATGGSDGDNLTSSEFTGSQEAKTGIYAFEKTDIFNILCIPPYKDDGNVDYDVTIRDAAP
jgi:hypothetical protein